MEIRLRKFNQYDHILTLVAVVNKLECGHLDYEHLDSGAIDLKTLHVDEAFRQRGIATGLINDFVKKVGPNIEIAATIMNEPTWLQLARSPFLRQSVENNPLDIKDPEVLRGFLMPKVLIRGGIFIEAMTIYHYPSDLFDQSIRDNLAKFDADTITEYFGCHIYGRTT